MQINRRIFQEHGILVPRTAYGPNMPSHQKLAAYARNPDQPLDDMQIEVGMTECTRLTFYEEFQASFIEECVQSGYHTVLLSSEHLSSRLTSNAEVDRLNEFINKLAMLKSSFICVAKTNF
jgi:hypothetical protein